MMAFLRLTLMVAMLVTGGAATADENLLKVRFATDWKAQAEQGGFYQAKALGLYEKAGLDVEIRGGGPGINIPQLLGAGAKCEIHTKNTASALGRSAKSGNKVSNGLSATWRNAKSLFVAESILLKKRKCSYDKI